MNNLESACCLYQEVEFNASWMDSIYSTAAVDGSVAAVGDLVPSTNFGPSPRAHAWSLNNGGRGLKLR